MKINWNIIKHIFIIIFIMIMIVIIYQTVRKEVPKENHCLEKELKYYRVVGGILSSSVETTKENSDYSKLKCVKWEEEPSMSKTLLGQRLIE